VFYVYSVAYTYGYRLFRSDL